MGARRVGRTGSVDDSESFRVIDTLERREAGMQAEEAVQVDRGISRDGERRAQLVIARLAERDHDVQSIGSSALEDRDQNFLTARGTVGGASEPGRRGADTKHRQTSAFDKRSSCEHRDLTFYEIP